MKKPIILLSLTFFAFNSWSQVVINRADYDRKASFTDNYSVMEATGLNVPSTGDAQSWDYSGVVKSGDYSRDYSDATADPDFSGALNSYPGTSTFNGLPIRSTFYEAIDNEGWYSMGRKTEDTAHSVSSITGGANDSLTFPGRNEIYVGRLNSLKFPVNYNDQWTEDRLDVVPFQLTVAAYGLDHVPCVLKSYRTHTRNVVGYGELILKGSDGNPTKALNCLLIEVQNTLVDSLFLNGQLPPDALLTAFGVTQGQKSSSKSYLFYGPGYGSPIMNINLDGDGKPTGGSYRSEAEQYVSIDEALISNFSIQPNPVKRGGMVSVASIQGDEFSTISVIDLQGKELLSISSNDLNAFEVPADLAPGVYFLKAVSYENHATGVMKLIVAE